MKKLFMMIVFLGLNTGAYATTPTITNVSGTIATGNTLTISGTNMVNETATNSNWDTNFQSDSKMYGFESSVSSGTGLTTSDTNHWHLGSNSPPPGEPSGSDAMNCKFTNAVKLAGNLSMDCHVRGGTNPNNPTNDGGSAVGSYPGSTSGNFYFRYYTRYHTNNGNYPDVYTKMTVTQPSGSGNMWYLDLAGAPAGQTPGGLTTKYGSISGPDASMKLQDDRWYCVEGVWLSPGTYQLWVDGKQVVNSSPGVSMPDNAYPQWGIINFASRNVVADFDQWLDNLAYGHSSRIYPSSTIEISGDGGSTWKWQPPTSLSETSIAVTAELPTLTASNYLLRVTNNLQQTSSTYNLSGGGGSSINGVCGSANGQSLTSLTSGSSNLCSSGSVTSFSGSGPWTWGCNGSGGGTSTSSTACSASLSVTSVNGACGSANGQSFASLTSTSSNLCSTGTVASFSGTGPWSWSCNGSGGGSSSACIASLSSTPSGDSGTLLFSESFESNSYASRGWYDNTDQGTIVSGGQSGNCLQWSWASGATTPTNGGSTRMKFTPTDSLYISYYVKFQPGWRGSQKTYHPHLMMILSDLDTAANAYSPLANNYLNTYLEFISDIGSPYTIRPQLALQDEKNVNTSYGSLPIDLSSTTENRSVGYCNTPLYSDAGGDCYADNPYYSAMRWKNSSVSISTGTWHHIEVNLKMNSISGGKGQSNGIMQEWIDGTQVINYTNMVYRTGQHPTKKWAQFVLAPYIGDGSPIAQTMWIDELTLATSPPNANTSITSPGGLMLKSVTP